MDYFGSIASSVSVETVYLFVFNELKSEDNTINTDTPIKVHVFAGYTKTTLRGCAGPVNK